MPERLAPGGTWGNLVGRETALAEKVKPTQQERDAKDLEALREYQCSRGGTFLGTTF